MDKKEQTAVAILCALIEMSDHAQSMGGATCIPGVAALSKMQRSIQKNKPRILDLVKEAVNA